MLYTCPQSIFQKFLVVTGQKDFKTNFQILQSIFVDFYPDIISSGNDFWIVGLLNWFLIFGSVFF